MSHEKMLTRSNFTFGPHCMLLFTFFFFVCALKLFEFIKKKNFSTNCPVTGVEECVNHVFFTPSPATSKTMLGLTRDLTHSQA